MLLGVIVRSKAVFKRPRALSQRSLSPPPKRRISSASVETSSSDGGTVGSPANKRDTLTELRDSPPADIDDIVFQYNTSQAKMADKESKDSSVKASPASEPSTPSMASSTGAVASPTVSADKSSVPSLEAQKKQLLDLQERARQYILTQTQRKGIIQGEAAEGTGQTVPRSCDTANVVQQRGESGGNDDDAPYDPEEGLDLDLSVTDPSPAKPVVASKPAEPSKPSSLQMLVSTLQRLQGAAPNLSALSNILPQGTMATSSVGPTQPNPNSGTTASTAASLSSVEIRPITSKGYGPQSSASASSILQPIIEASRGFQSVASPDSASQQTVSTIHESQPSSALSSTEHLSQSGVPSGGSSHHAISSTQRPQSSPSSDQRLRLGLSSAQRLQPQGSSDQSRHLGSSSDHGPHPAPSSDDRLQRRSFSDHRLQSGTYSDHRPHLGPSSNRRSQVGPPDRRQELGPSSDLPSRPSADQRLQPGSASVQGHPSGPSGSSHANRWNPSEPPQVTRQVNNINQDIQKYGDLRPEDRARLAAHESRLESRENRRSSSDHRDEHCEQRGMDDMHRSGWHNDPRHPRDSRNPRDDSRRNWRDEYRHGRPWYGNEQRQDRYENQIAERPRHEDRRRFKEHWSRDRWRR